MERKYLYWVNSLESRSDTSDVTDVTTSQQLAVPQSHAAVGPQTLELCSLQSQGPVDAGFLDLAAKKLNF